jgi:Flp pilus assembly protein TadG
MNKRPFANVDRSARRQAGGAAVEFALLLPLLVPFLTLGFFTVSILWHYTMAQKAAQDAARYLSTLSQAEITNPALASAAGALAKQIVMRELEEISPASELTEILTYCDVTTVVSITCGGGAATATPPASVQVHFSILMFDPLGLVDTGWYGLKITANHTIRYVGN